MFPAQLVSTKNFFAEDFFSAETVSDRTSGMYASPYGGKVVDCALEDHFRSGRTIAYGTAGGVAGRQQTRLNGSRVGFAIRSKQRM